MRKKLGLLMLLAIAASLQAYSQISFTGEYTQDFNTCAGTIASIPTGWVFTGNPSAEKGIATGTGNAGGIYAYGTGGEYALGFLHSGSSTPLGAYTAIFTNSTTSTITSLYIAYDFEQWRGGGSNTSGFPTVTVNGTTIAALGQAGNASSPSGTCVTTPKSATVAVSIAPGATITIKWQSDDLSGSDNGIAIDNFKMCIPGKAFTATAGSTSPVTAPAPIVFSGGASAGTPTYTYSWAGPSYTSSVQNPIITPSDVTNSGTYTVTVTDAIGCTATATTAVTVIAGSTCTGTPAGGTAAVSPASFCGSGASTLTLTGGTAASDITYQWYSSPTGAGGSFTAISGATSAVYNTPTLTATTYYQIQSTCPSSALSSTSATGTVVINPLPTISATPAGGNICSAGSGLSMTANGAATYTWAPATGLSATTGAIVTANPTSNITYTITGTSAAGCTGTTNVTVNYRITPAAVSVTPATLGVCVGAAPQLLTATGGLIGPTTVNSGTVTIPSSIAAGGTISTDLILNGVPAGAVITGASVNVISFGSQYQDDYVLNLKAPNGNILNLVKNRGSHTATVTTLFGNTVLSSAGSAAVATGTTPFTGTWLADAILPAGIAPYAANVTDWASLYSVPNGTWTLAFYNSTAFGNVVTPAMQWSITLNYSYQAPITWSPVTNLYTDAGATTPYTGAAATSVYVNAATAATTTYTATATNATCSVTATTAVSVNPLPAAYNVTGGGSYCSGSTGVTIGLDNSATGVNYQLYNGATAIGTAVAGTGSALSFGTYTTAGTYTVVATNASTTCTANMTGSATITINPLPTTYNVTGGGSYCTGGTGVAVGLDNSDAGINYQLYNGTTAVGTAVAGTGSAISFGSYTAAGTYSVLATNATTTCTNGMTGSATITINALPTTYNVTGGGSYCSGSTGVTIGLDNSATGISYQLYNGATTAGTAVAGTGAAISFGTFTTAGTYTVLATNTTTTCINNMTGNAVISINPLPTAYNVTGGGSYCAGGTGVAIGIDNSATGINYQLYNGATAIGTAVSGTGAAISFGTFTATGTYTVLATNGTTSCTNSMTGSAVITINPLPTAYNVTGGGTYCTGGTGVTIGLDNSAAGFTYQLYNGAAATGTAIAGTGAAISFGTYTAAGTYTVLATNTTTGCTNAMTGSVVITINPLPTAHTVTGGGSYCSGGTGVVAGLDNSDAGISYQLYNGATAAGTAVAGTGAAITFGLQTAAGTYTVLATNTTTGCTNAMTGNAVITINPLPTAYNVTGGGSYCAGATGVTIGLDNSAAGINYQLYDGATAAGTAVAGTGAAISFGTYTTAGTYTVLATNATTTCVNNMTGSAVITINALPTAFSVTGGGSYCSGGTGVTVGLGNSATGISYQLYNGAAATGTAVAGTGAAISFGSYTAAGTYSVLATNTTTSCANSMTGTAIITIDPLPTAYNVTGGGNYCAGGTGVVVGLDNSTTGINYQLYNGTTATGTAIAGTGAALNFGLQTAAGTYTVRATNATTGCIADMSSSATIVINPLPLTYAVTGGGSYCTGGTGVAIGLGNSETGVNYQLYNGATAAGTAMAGTGAAISFGTFTATGTYTVSATNATTTCGSNMSGSATVIINTLPVVHNVTGGGAYCAGGTGVAIGLDNSNTGINYQLYNGATAVGTAVAGTGAALSFGLQTTAGIYTVTASDGSSACTSNMTGSATITINPLPTVHNVTGGGSLCAGATGVAVGLDNSDAGISYQLYNGAATSGTALAGTGAALNFGLKTTAGTYTVLATNTTTGCTNAMTGNAVVVVNALPTAFAISGGGAYCAGGTGVAIGQVNSTTGVNYQLYNGAATAGTAVAGTGAAISFGVFTATGTYSVRATNATTGCTANMTGTVSVTINTLPTAYAVTGGGSYCAGGTGVAVGLGNSATGISYQLYNGAATAGTAVAGTGGSISFGTFTAAGTYTVLATNTTTGCTRAMTGNAVITINPLPTAFAVTGGGAYCAGGTGVTVGLATTNTGINYQLYNGAATVGSPVAGTGAAISFGTFTTAGTYSVLATNATTGCTRAMTGSVNISINPLPAAFAVTGGGSYCAGAAGVAVGLGNSATGINYQLYNGAATAGGPVAGTGSAITFGTFTAAGTYTVRATNATTGCTSPMTGNAVIVINPLPTAFAVTGGGSYCAGGIGVAVGLGNSAAGIDYQLYNGATVTGSVVSGTGAAISFGLQTTTGTYTVLSTNTTTGCTNAMTGSATITINVVLIPSVTLTTSTGTDTSCSSSIVTYTATPVNGGTTPAYAWTINGTPTGTGLATYSYAPTDGDQIIVKLTSNYICAIPDTAKDTVNMTVIGTVMPDVTITSSPGNPVCEGTSVTFSAAPVNGGTAPFIRWTENGINVATGPTYTYIPSNGDNVYCMMKSNFQCILADSVFSNHIVVVVNPTPATPVVNIVANPGTTIAEGQTETLTAVTTGGGSYTYQWLVNGTPVAGATNAAYISNTFANNDVATCIVTTNDACALADTQSVTILVNSTGITTLEENAGFVISPNPNGGRFTITGSTGTGADATVSVELVNMIGQVVYKHTFMAHGGNISEPVITDNSLANGTYLLNIHSGSANRVIRVSIQQ